MHNALQAAREQARQWREAKGEEAAGGMVLILDGLFVGWMPELPPAEQWAAGCLAIAGDDHAYLIDQQSWREPLQWFDLEPPPETEPDPPPLQPENNPTTSMNESTPLAGNTYRFRAECEPDVQALLALIPDGELLGFETREIKIPDFPIPDFAYDITVKSLALDDLRALCRELEDGHVMLQTIQPAADYTGERDYDME